MAKQMSPNLDPLRQKGTEQSRSPQTHLRLALVSQMSSIMYSKIVSYYIYLWIHTALRSSSDAEVAALKARYGLPNRYILFLGSVEKRKNLHGLLEAYTLLQQMEVHLPLVIAGLKPRNYPALERILQRLEQPESVMFTGYIPDRDLPALYSGVDLFVFPSLYEGFGLPLLEAMACGTPVVCSNAGSLPEVVGDAALLVDPYDVEALTAAMHRVLCDAALREELRQKGLTRARMFTWEKAARETLAVYEEVLV